MGRHVGTGVERDGQRARTCEHCFALPDLQSKPKNSIADFEHGEFKTQ